MKWYWVVTIAIVVFIIAYWIGKQQQLAKAISQEKDVNIKLGEVLTQLNDTKTRITPETRTRLTTERDRLLRLKNPTRESMNFTVRVTSPQGPNYTLWNGWVYIDETPAQRTCAGGTLCRFYGLLGPDANGVYTTVSWCAACPAGQ